MSTYIEPPIDNLNDKVPSKYELSYLVSNRANQIDKYYRELAEGVITVPGPLTDHENNDHPTAIAMNELNQDKISLKYVEEIQEDTLDVLAPIEIEEL